MKFCSSFRWKMQDYIILHTAATNLLFSLSFWFSLSLRVSSPELLLSSANDGCLCLLGAFCSSYWKKQKKFFHTNVLTVFFFLLIIGCSLAGMGKIWEHKGKPQTFNKQNKAFLYEIQVREECPLVADFVILSLSKLLSQWVAGELFYWLPYLYIKAPCEITSVWQKLSPAWDWSHKLLWTPGNPQKKHSWLPSQWTDATADVHLDWNQTHNDSFYCALDCNDPSGEKRFQKCSRTCELEQRLESFWTGYLKTVCILPVKHHLSWKWPGSTCTLQRQQEENVQ